MSKANTRNPRAPIPAVDDPERPSIAEQVIALREAGEIEAAYALMAKARRQALEALDEVLSARLVLEGASIPVPRRQRLWPDLTR